MSAVAPAQAAITTYNPFDANAGFTIVSTGDAHLANGELEGSIAAFGSISSDNINGYPVLHQAAGMADYTVPVVDGDPVRVLAGTFTGTGSFDLANRDDSGTISSSSPEANAIAKLADTTGFTAQTRSGGVGNNAGGEFPRVSNPAGGFLDLKALPYETSHSRTSRPQRARSPRTSRILRTRSRRPTPASRPCTATRSSRTR